MELSRLNLPRVSIITIFLNPGPFLEESIVSVLAQTFVDLELLLVDDGSTDESTTIAKRWQCRHPDRIRYLEHPGHENRGMSVSRNLALEYAKGEFIAILDADDIWPTRKLDEQLLIMDRYPEAVFLYGPARYWYSWENAPEKAQRDFVQDIGVQHETIFPPGALLNLWVQNSAMTACTGTYLLRREPTKDAGGGVDSFRGLYEDQVFCIKIGSRYPVVVSPQVWLKYRQHEGSCCSIGGRKKLHWSARQDFLLWAYRFLKREGLGGSEAGQYVKKEYLRRLQQARERGQVPRHVKDS